MPGFTSNM